MQWIDSLLDVRRAARDLCGGVAVAIGVAGAALAAGCGTAREQAAPDRNAVTATASPMNTASTHAPSAGADAGPPSVAFVEYAGAVGAEPGDAGARLAEVEPPAKARTGALAHFFADLDGLVKGTRKDHVRILWLGDSHGQADFWSGKLRSVLQKRFGNGGPGFIHIAFKGYRHDGVDLSMKDKWSTLPLGPATGKRVADGVFGLGGLLTSTTSAGAEAVVEIRDASLSGKLQWDLCYRFTRPGESVRVSLTGQKPVTLTAGAKVPEKPPLLHTKLTTNGARGEASGKEAPAVAGAGNPKDQAGKSHRPRLTVAPTSGYPYFCGVVVETDPLESPGVVLDTAGINGARYTTALAWDEEAWLAELSRRSPSLVIFEYGTNEAGDVGIKVESYSDKVARLVGRVRKKKADTDCVILAPTERADQEERSARIRNVLRDAAKANSCWFWDTIESMGGKGSMRAWRDENPPKGAKDGIHLTVRGYHALGEKLAADLLEKY